MIPDITSSDVVPLVIGAAGLALISFNSAMVTARSFAVKNRYEIDSNQEFIALGVADIGAGLLQGFAISGADSRTAVNDSVGGKSQVTGLVAAGLLVLVLLVFTAPLALLPITVLAAVLINAAIGLFDLPSLIRLRRVSRQEFRLQWSRSWGSSLSACCPESSSRCRWRSCSFWPGPHTHMTPCWDGCQAPGLSTTHDHPQGETFPGLVIYRFDASLLFFNSDHFKSRVRSIVKEAQTGVRCFLLDAETMPFMDTTGAASIDEMCAELGRARHRLRDRRRKVTGPLHARSDRADGADWATRLFSTVESAVAAFGPSLRNPAG